MACTPESKAHIVGDPLLCQLAQNTHVRKHLQQYRHFHPPPLKSGPPRRNSSPTLGRPPALSAYVEEP
jgi:hypothetical protein